MGVSAVEIIVELIGFSVEPNAKRATNVGPKLGLRPDRGEVVVGEMGEALCQSLLTIREDVQGQADLFRTSVTGRNGRGLQPANGPRFGNVLGLNYSSLFESMLK